MIASFTPTSAIPFVSTTTFAWLEMWDSDKYQRQYFVDGILFLSVLGSKAKAVIIDCVDLGLVALEI
jgi:hypothetical protein